MPIEAPASAEEPKMPQTPQIRIDGDKYYLAVTPEIEVEHKNPFGGSFAGNVSGKTEYPLGTKEDIATGFTTIVIGQDIYKIVEIGENQVTLESTTYREDDGGNYDIDDLNVSIKFNVTDQEYKITTGDKTINAKPYQKIKISDNLSIEIDGNASIIKIFKKITQDLIK